MEVVMTDKCFMVSLQGQMPVGVVVVTPDLVLILVVDGVLQKDVHVFHVFAVIQDRSGQLLTSLNKINIINHISIPFPLPHPAYLQVLLGVLDVVEGEKLGVSRQAERSPYGVAQTKLIFG